MLKLLDVVVLDDVEKHRLSDISQIRIKLIDFFLDVVQMLREERTMLNTYE
jgi:hypothetical protein